MSRMLILAVAFAVVACGSVSTASPGNPGGGGTQDGGAGAGSGGSGGAAPAADAGSGSGSGSPGSAPSGGGSGPVAGGDTGSGTGSGSGGGSSGGGGNGGGGPRDECAGFAPGPVGDPNGAAASSGGHYFEPTGALSDGFGNVALIEELRQAPAEITIHFHEPSGAESGSFRGSGPYQSWKTRVMEQLAGVIVSHDSGGLDGRGSVSAVDARGKVTATTGLADETFDLAIDPLGGVTALSRRKGADAQTAKTVVSFDEQVKERWRGQLPTADRVLAFATDRQGNTLVLVDGSSRYGAGTAGGVWIDHSGHAGDEFKATDAEVGDLYPRVGSGLFMRDRWGSWVAQFEPFGPGAPPPAWLSSRDAGTTLHMARNGRAYAVIAPPSSARGTCSTSVDVVAPSGKNCGTAVFPSPVVQQFGVSSCSSQIVVGYDGTAIQRTEKVWEGGGSSNYSVPHRWWTGFFR